MNLKNAIIAGLLIGSAHGMTVPVKAHHPELDNPVSLSDSKITKGYYTMDAMGCMLVRECTDGVDKVKSIADIDAEYPDSDFGFITNEFNSILSLDRIGVEVFLADSKYFPVGHRGVYHTVSNNFF